MIDGCEIVSFINEKIKSTFASHITCTLHINYMKYSDGKAAVLIPLFHDNVYRVYSSWEYGTEKLMCEGNGKCYVHNMFWIIRSS